MSNLAEFSRKDVVVVFSYAPAGLGHLRVTDALYEGLPSGARPLLLGSHDEVIKRLHRITSIHPLMRAVMEWTQRGVAEDVVTKYYRKSLVRAHKKIYEQVLTLVDQRLEVPRVLVVVATHFGLAHQLSAVKDRLWEERKVRMVLVVTVTDDSPQHMWYVENADVIFVPSETTRESLARYGRQEGLKAVEIEVVAYPVSPVMGEKLEVARWRERERQVARGSESVVHVSVPISGAAVGMDFYRKLIDKMGQSRRKYLFHVVARNSVNTNMFLGSMAGRADVAIRSSTSDRDVVDMYQKVFEEYPVSIEVTKPSEQAFKALYSTRQIGGSVMFFAQPVGRQEYDNLEFLRRHNLIPTRGEKEWMWRLAQESRPLEGVRGKAILTDAVYWRGLRLPMGSKDSARFIDWSIEQGLVEMMMKCEALPRKYDDHKHELSSNGVETIWEKVGEMVERDLVEMS